jgi:hypothetical protein
MASVLELELPEAADVVAAALAVLAEPVAAGVAVPEPPQPAASSRRLPRTAATLDLVPSPRPEAMTAPLRPGPETAGNRITLLSGGVGT